MNDQTTFAANVIAARMACKRVSALWADNEYLDRGVMTMYLYEKLETIGINFPGLEMHLQGGKYASNFSEWLGEIEMYFFTIAALYDITLPEKE